MENPLFEAYLESLGIPQGASVTYRDDLIAAMYRAGCILSQGWVPPVFPITRMKGGWVGWLAQEADLQGAEGWPASSLVTRLTIRSDARRHVESIETMCSSRFDDVAALLRFGQKWKGEERAALVRGFARAVGHDARKEAWTIEFIAFCEEVFLRTVKAEKDAPPHRWRKLAKDLGL